MFHSHLSGVYDIFVTLGKRLRTRAPQPWVDPYMKIDIVDEVSKAVASLAEAQKTLFDVVSQGYTVESLRSAESYLKRYAPDLYNQIGVGAPSTAPAAPPVPVPAPYPVFTCTYRNHAGQVGKRAFVPVAIEYKATPWHTTPQWIVQAYDHSKGDYRGFALNDILTPYADEIIGQLMHHLKPILNIAVAYRNNGLDEARPEWSHLGLTDPNKVEIFAGRGGKELLNLEQCLAAHRYVTELADGRPHTKISPPDADLVIEPIEQSPGIKHIQMAGRGHCPVKQPLFVGIDFGEHQVKDEKPAEDTNTTRRLLDLLYLADDALMWSHGCFPLDRSSPKNRRINDACKLIRDVTGNDGYAVREERIKQIRADLKLAD